MKRNRYLLISLVLVLILGACAAPTATPAATTAPAAPTKASEAIQPTQMPAIEKAKFTAWDLGFIDEANPVMLEKYNAQSTLYQLEYNNALQGVDFMTEGVQKLRLAYENDQGPDLMGNVASGAMLKTLVESGKIQDLTSVYAERGWDKVVPANLVKNATIEGKIYGVPIDISTVGLFYNKNIYTELGLKEPKTYDELIANFKSIKDAGYYGYAIGLAKGWPSAYMASQFGYITGGSKYLAAMKGELPWTECADCLKALQQYYYVATEFGNPDIVGIEWSQADDLFFQGKTAMVLRGNEFLTQLATADPDFEVGFFHMPVINPDTDISVFGGEGGVYIVSTTGNKEAAYDYIDWFLNPKTAPELIRALPGFVPAITGYEVPTDIDPLPAAIARATEENIGSLGFWPANYMPGYLFSDYNQFIQGMMIGELTPEGVIQKLQADREKYNKENPTK